MEVNGVCPECLEDIKLEEWETVEVVCLSCNTELTVHFDEAYNEETYEEELIIEIEKRGAPIA